MTSPPKSLINRHKLLALDLSKSQDPQFNNVLETIATSNRLTPSCTSNYAPWVDECLNDFLSKATNESLAIFSPTVETFSIALAMHALHLGFRTFLILPDEPATLTLRHIRLVQTGVVILTICDFLAECELCD